MLMTPLTKPSRDTAGRRVRFIHDADWYKHPRWYDILHAAGTAAEVRGLERLAQQWAGGRDGRPLTIFEPACGTARHLRIAAARGHRVIGLDQSTSMLDYARAALARRGLTGTLIEGDMRVIDRGALGLTRREHIDIAFCPVNSIRHLMSDRDMIDHLRSTAALLGPRGVYAVGIGLTHYGIEQPSEDVWRGARGRCSVTQLVQYLPGEDNERLEAVISHLTVVTPTQEIHVDHRYVLRRYNAEQWAAVVRRAGLEVVAAVDEAGTPVAGSDDPMAQGYAVYLLRRR